MQQGGSINGIIAALNRIIDITVPEDKQEGGTYVIPGHGRWPTKPTWSNIATW